MAKKWCYNEFWMKTFWEEKMKTRENKRIVKLYLFFFQNCPFWTCIEKISTFTFGAWPFLFIHIRFTPSKRPKGFVNWWFTKSDHGCWTIKSDNGKKPSSMVWFHDPWCKAAPSTFLTAHATTVLHHMGSLASFLSVLLLLVSVGYNLLPYSYDLNTCTRLFMTRDLGKPTHTLVPCWMPKPLPPRNQCTG